MNWWNESQLVWKLKKLFTFFVMLVAVFYMVRLPLAPGEEALSIAILVGAWMLSYKLTP